MNSHDKTPVIFDDGTSHYDARRHISKGTLQKLAINLGLEGVNPTCGFIANIIKGKIVSLTADADVPDLDWFSGDLYDFIMEEGNKVLSL